MAPPVVVPEPVETVPSAAAPARPAYQPNLFAGQPDAPKVVPIRAGGERRTHSSKVQVRHSAVAGELRYEQQSLILASGGDSGSSRSREMLVACNAKVAGPKPRFLAFLIDLALVVAAAGMALGGCVAWAGVSLNGRSAAMFLGGGLLLVWMLYQSLWCAANLDTVGMSWLGLHCVDLNGYRPRPRKRFIRLGVTCLGTLAAGLGLAWALVDEEGLAWQDHVSETFPTRI